MSRQSKFADASKKTTVPETTDKSSAPPVQTPAPENHAPQKSNPRQAFREGLNPEPTPDVSASPLTAPKIDKDYTTTGISKPPAQTPGTSPPPPPPPAQNNAAKVGALPPPDDDEPHPQPSEPSPGASPPEETAASQSFTPPPGTADPSKYTMPGNYALRTAEDVFNGANYALKWTVAPWLYVPRKREFIKYEKATKHISDVTQKIPPSNLKDRLKTHNAGVRDKMALDGEDKELFVPTMAAWFHETGFHLSPGGRAALAAVQIILRKVGDIGNISRENKEFVAELQEEVSKFLELYEKEFKPMLAVVENNKTRETMNVNTPQPPAEPPKGKDATVKKDEK